MRQTIERTLWACAWADECEERGTLPPQCRIEDECGDVPPEAAAEAAALADRVVRAWERASGRTFEASWAEHAAAAGYDVEDVDARERFAHYAAMQAQGHGVSWYDDHPAPASGEVRRLAQVETYALRGYVA